MSESIKVRASSVSAWLDCPYRASAIYLEGMRTPTSLAATLGKAIHKGTALFDTERLDGSSGSVGAAMDAAAEAMDKPDEEVALEPEDKPAQSLDVAVSLTQKYCEDFAPGIEYAAVELTVDALELTDLGITLTGTTDRVRRSHDQLGIADLKSGKSAVSADGRCKTAGHAVQLGVYELIAEVGMGVKMHAPAAIIGLQTNLTPDKQRIALGEVWRPSETLTGDETHPGILPTLAKFVKGEVMYGNPKSYLCSGKFCPRYSTCFFRR